MATRAFDSFATSMPKLDRDPITHTQSPVTTGTSVLAVAYDGGIVMAADMLGSYGSLARYRSVPRIIKINDQTVIGCMGDYADFQHVKAIIEQMEIDEQCKDDGFQTTARSLHSWLTRVLYNKRCKMDPWWTTFVVAGTDIDSATGAKKPFLGFVDKLGTAYEDPIIATGYGSMLATPMMRKALEDKGPGGVLTEAEARVVLVEGLKLMFYRDARSSPKYQVAVIPTNGPAKIEEAAQLTGEWSVAKLIKGYE